MPGLITVTLIDAHNMQPLFSNVATPVNQHMIINNYIMLHQSFDPLPEELDFDEPKSQLSQCSRN